MNAIEMKINIRDKYNRTKPDATIYIDGTKTWDDYAEELVKQGFLLDDDLIMVDIDECVKDIAIDCHIHTAEEIVDAFYYSDVFFDDYKEEIFDAWIEINGLHDWLETYNRKGEGWADDTEFYGGMSLDEVAEQLLNDCGDIPEYLAPYIDYDRFASDMRYDGYYEVAGGVVRFA